MVAPATFVLALAFGLPLVGLMLFSLTDFRLGTASASWVGLRNYQDVLSSPNFYRALGNTVFFVALYVPANIILSLGLALLLNQRYRFISLFRLIYFLPVVLSVTSVAVIALWVFDPQVGMLTWITRTLGIPEQRLLQAPTSAMLVIIVVSLWQFLGYDIAIFVAALQGIPEDLYEAASIDGAGPISKFKSVTVPALAQILFFMVLTQIVFAFQVFDQILVLTKGGPGVGGTTTLVYEIFRQGFQLFKFGPAAAIGFILLVIVLAITAVNYRFFRPEEYL